MKKGMKISWLTLCEGKVTKVIGLVSSEVINNHFTAIGSCEGSGRIWGEVLNQSRAFDITILA